MKLNEKIMDFFLLHLIYIYNFIYVWHKREFDIYDYDAWNT